MYYVTIITVPRHTFAIVLATELVRGETTTEVLVGGFGKAR
jgi:hypothetical protein